MESADDAENNTTYPGCSVSLFEVKVKKQQIFIQFRL